MADQSRFQLLRRIIEDAIDLHGEALRKYLDHACGHDPSLRAEAEKYLSHRDMPTLVSVSLPVEDSPPPAKVGSYVLEERIGRGGTSDVYKTRQTGYLRRPVAIKLLKIRLPGMLARFMKECQAMANMSHPNIATVHEADIIAQTNQPYLVMQYLEGQKPITEYADQRKLGWRERLVLFLQVCDAIEHAHGNGVIHLDIKPSNVLVTQKDRCVKVIDFGIARAAEGDSRADGSGTPQWIAPEQITGRANISKRTDIHGLGILLYHLLAGMGPFDHQPGASRDDILAQMEKAARPSPADRLASIPHVQAEECARSRNLSLSNLKRRLRGELECIVSKAIAVNPEDRYESVRLLSDDIRNYLNHFPVIAAKRGRIYWTTKFMRRNWIVISAISILFAAATSVSVMLLHENKLRHSAEAAEQSAIKAKAIAIARANDVRVLANDMIFRFHDQIARLPGGTAVRANLVKTSLAYLASLANDAIDNADLQHELWVAYIKLGDIEGGPGGSNLGNNQAAMLAYQSALPLAQKLASTGEPSGQAALASNLERIGDIHLQQWQMKQAEQNYRKAQEIRLLLAKDLRAARYQFEPALTHDKLGFLLQKQQTWELALAEFRSSLLIRTIRVNQQPNNSVAFHDRALSHAHIADVLMAMAKTHDALSELEQGQVDLQRCLQIDPKDIDALGSLSIAQERMGDICMLEGRIDEALKNFQLSYDYRKQVAEIDLPNAQARRNLAVIQSRIGDVLVMQSKANDALTAQQKSLTILRELARDRTNIEAQRDLAVVLDRVAKLLINTGDLPQALKLYKECLTIDQNLAALQPNDLETLRSVVNDYQNVGDIYVMLKANHDAISSFDSAIKAIEVIESRKLATARDTMMKVIIKFKQNASASEFSPK